MLAYPMPMGNSKQGWRALLRMGGLFLATLAFVTPAAAQGPTVLGQDLTVFGFSPLFQAGIAGLFLLNIAIIMTVSFEDYTTRTTDVVLTDPRGTLMTGIRVALMILGPYAGLVAVMLLFDAVGLFSLALLTVFAIPLVWIGLTAIGIGLISAGRMASEKEGLQLTVVAAIALPLGAFPIPFAALGIVAALYGLGAIVWDLRYGESDLESRERETYGRQHRYL
jgi:hypothetical protein